MASLFDSFRNSSMPKRLLRYALSRFDVLDADALDLDNLDLAWGMKTVLEFRDVGLRVKNLQQLLQLPPTFHIQRAKVALLRVTLPVDIYSSPIQIQVTGIDVRLRVSAREDEQRPGPGRRRNSKTGSNPTDDTPASDAVPSAVDLAQSFLEQEPSSEAKALEAALAASDYRQHHNNNLSASIQSSDYDSDDDALSSYSELGTGQALTLPAFLADFLQGIVDRIQVNIEGVTFQLEVDVPVADDAPPTETGLESVTFRLALSHINVEGVTTTAASPSANADDGGDDSRPKIVPKEGKRHISLDNVRAFLISEANVFSALAQSPVLPPSVAPESPPASDSGDAMAESMAASSVLMQSHHPLQDSEDAFNIPYDNLESSSDEENEHAPEHAPEPAPEPAPASSLSTPRASVYGDMPSGGSPPLPTNSLRVVQSAIVGGGHDEAHTRAQTAGGQLEAHSEPSPDHLHETARSTGSLRPAPVGLGLAPEALAETFYSSLGLTGPSHAEVQHIDATEDDDLSMSHVYSHEEAESMYLSAFSQAESVRLRGNMPGAWDMEDSDHDHLQDTPLAVSRPFEKASDANATPTMPPLEESAAQKPGASNSPSAVREDILVDSVFLPSTPKGSSPRPDAHVPAADDAATPRGPTQLVREILSLEYISIYVPSNHKHVEVPKPTQPSDDKLGKSISPHLPGAFSVHMSTGFSSTYGEMSMHEQLDNSQFQQSQRTDSPPADETSVEVNLAPLEICFDASIGFLLVKVVSELLRSLKNGMAQQQEQEQQKKASKASENTGDAKDTPASLPDIKFHADKISLLFLDKLRGVADTAERFFESPKKAVQNRDVLLQAVFENLAVALSQMLKPSTGVQTNTTVDLQRFRFGYSDADILSFDRQIQMRASVRDAFPPSGDDVSVRVSQSADATKYEISTLPLRVAVDLQRLDETFSWFGGLSSFLSMGSSSISSAMPQANMAAVAAPAKPVPKARGVRFETPISPDDNSAAAENKINMRIGGMHLELMGRDCSVLLDTSALKMVSREEGIGMGFSRVRLAGPYLRNSRGSPPVTVEINNTRLEFLNVPKDKDLERLLELITPSRVKFDEREDVIMVDTLLRQRRSGPLLRLSIDDINVQAHNLVQLSCLPSLGEEVGRLATVAKYLPEDDRPGLLTLGLVRRFDVSVDVGGRVGMLQASLTDVETAHISIPALVSTAIGTISVHRNQTEELVGSSSVPANAAPTSTAPATTMTTVTATAKTAAANAGTSPALMLRVIGDDMEPVIKVKMWGLNFEYRVPTLMDVLDLADDATPEEFEASLAASVASLTEQAQSAILNSRGVTHNLSADSGTQKGKAPPSGTSSPGPEAKPTMVDISFRDCVLGMNPLGLTSKLNVVLVDARLEAVLPQGEEIDAVAHLGKMSLLLVDDVATVSPAASGEQPRYRSASQSAAAKSMVRRLCSRGFVDICQISSARIAVHVSAPDAEEGQRVVDLEVRDDLLVLETCADSTQTLIALANALAPPTPPSKEVKFKTKVMPVKDLLASISIDAFGQAEGNYNFDEDFVMEGRNHADEEDPDPYYGGGTSGSGSGSGFGHLNLSGYQAADRAIEQSVASLPSVPDEDLILDDDDVDEDIEGTHPPHPTEGIVAEKLFSASSILSDGTATMENTHGDGHASHSASDDLSLDEGFFGTATEMAAEEASPGRRWSSTQNTYEKSSARAKRTTVQVPLQVRIRDVHVIWNLFDGYDWQHTRDVITHTVEEVEAKALERTRRRRAGHDQFSPYADEEEEDAVIGDFLFNSIYIGIPASHDPRELAQAIQQDIYGDGGGAETESVAATSVTATSSRAPGSHGGGGHYRGGGGSRGSRTKRNLKLNRSRRHKITFELGGVCADLVMFPPGSGETQASVELRVHDLDVFDHVPTSTWKKFATYDRDAGERPIDGQMVRMEVLVVKPVAELAATELVLKVALLPLRLHVDQDALDFITRFFEFKEEPSSNTGSNGNKRVVKPSASDQPFIQRAEIMDIPVQLDFKPKRVDYAGLRSGHTTEFMNFLILDGSRMTMRHTIIYGVSGFERLGQTLNDIWMPDIKRHQLPGVLAGLAPVRSLVTVGSGFRDLIEIPLQEYQHNGRIVRSISKGAMAFARSTGTELVKLGAKVATGTQYVLQGAEGMLVRDGVGGSGSGGNGTSGFSNGNAIGVAGAQDGGVLVLDGEDGEGVPEDDADERKQISLYADQPTDVMQGLRHAYSSLARDLNVARDAVIAVPAEVRESTSAAGAAKVVIRHAPTIIFRPAIGATKAIGQTLMGATNSLDPQNLRRAEDKYKSGPGRV